MDSQECLSILSEIHESIEGNFQLVRYQEMLSKLSIVLSVTNQDVPSRHNIGLCVSVWGKTLQILEHSAATYSMEDLNVFEWKLRIVRGVMLLCRNLISLPSNDLQQCPQIDTLIAQVNSHQDFAVKIVKACQIPVQGVSIGLKEIFDKTLVACFQFLANSSNQFFDKHNASSLLCQVSLEEIPDDAFLPFLIYLNNLFTSSDFAYRFLNAGVSLSPITDWFHKVENDSEKLEEQEVLILSIFTKVISHESFIKLLQNTPKSDTGGILKMAQLVLSNKESWDTFQLTNILCWLTEMFDSLDTTCTQILCLERCLSSEEACELELCHVQMVIILDCLSSLARFDHSTKFLKAYSYFDKFVDFFKTVQLHTERKVLTAKRQKTDGFPKSFPQVKSILMEILTFLVCNDFQLQEQARELHFLELALLNCNIDENDPYIRERSVVFLKYALSENAKNQHLISSLEAREPAIEDEGALERMGLEVDIVDGKVQLRKTK